MSKMRRGLGSGLEILLGNTSVFDLEQKDSSHIIVDLDIDTVFANPGQPRKVFDEGALLELSESIKFYGVLQPILVAEDSNSFVLVAGERRLRASKIAGLKTIPAIVLKHKTTEDQYKISILENIQRENLNPIEEAAAYKFLIDNFGYTHEVLAEKLNKSRSYITNSLRVLKLPESVIKMISEGKISHGHAKVLSGMSDEEAVQAAEKIDEQKLSVRDLESYAKTKKKKPSKTSKIKAKMLDMMALQQDSSFDKQSILDDISQEMTEIVNCNFNIVDKDNSFYVNIKIDDVKKLSRLIDILVNNS